MKSSFAVVGTMVLLFVAIQFSVARQLNSSAIKPVEVATLNESNWDQFIPVGQISSQSLIRKIANRQHALHSHEFRLRIYQWRKSPLQC